MNKNANNLKEFQKDDYYQYLLWLYRNKESYFIFGVNNGFTSIFLGFNN